MREIYNWFLFLFCKVKREKEKKTKNPEDLLTGIWLITTVGPPPSHTHKEGHT